MKKALLSSVLGLIFLGLSVGVVTFIQTQKVNASDARNFNAGKIIDDSIFTNSNSMSVQDIQNFINSKVKCDTQGAKRSELGGGTRAQWMASKGISTPLRCLADYRENVTNGQNNYSKDAPAGSISAAEIIYNYSRQFGINPQVLLVTLQKENSLITDEWPTPKQFSEAMGFGCPDNVAPGAPACDASYGSFAAQIYEAARHFRGFFNNTSGWYIPFTTGNNYVRWSPNASCGGSTVNIQNRATVALYSYTPYQPNQSAKNAQYGLGDSCGAYGNRNFYLYFNDWFGSTEYTSLVRTIDNSTVYVISGSSKYPIADMNVFNALYPLGAVSYVPQSYLDAKTTGQTMGRVIRSSNGSVYFFDAGIKLGFNSCAQVEAYGSSCGQSVLFEDYMINSLHTGPNMTNLFGTTSGKTFYIMDGKKHEVYDQESLKVANITDGTNVLSEPALSNLSYGAPVVRGDVIIQDRTSGSKYLYTNQSATPVSNDLLAGSYLKNITLWPLDSASLSQVNKTAETKGYLKSSTGIVYAISGSGKIALSSPEIWTSAYTPVSDSLLSVIPTIATNTQPYTVKSSTNGTIYLLEAATKRAISSWDDYVALSAGQSLITLPDFYVNNIAEGDQLLNITGLVVSPSGGTVYMIDGTGRKIPMSSFAPAVELRSGSLQVVSQALLDKYVTAPDVLTNEVNCNGRKGIAIGGNVYEMNYSYLTYTNLSQYTCQRLTWKAAPIFALGANGTIYQFSNSQKRPIASYSTYLALGGNSNNTINASNYVLDQIQTGLLL